MKTTYLLPCCCGRTIPVEPRQAGEAIQCACGKPVQVPTLLEMTTLERSEPVVPAAPPSVGWGWPQRLVFLGIVMAVASCVAVILVVQKRPSAPTEGVTPEFVLSQVQRLSPAATIKFFRRTLETGLDAKKFPPEQAYAEAMDRYWSWLIILAITGGVGATLIALGSWNLFRAASTSVRRK